MNIENIEPTQHDTGDDMRRNDLLTAIIDNIESDYVFLRDADGADLGQCRTHTLLRDLWYSVMQVESQTPDGNTEYVAVADIDTITPCD